MAKSKKTTDKKIYSTADLEKVHERWEDLFYGLQLLIKKYDSKRKIIPAFYTNVIDHDLEVLKTRPTFQTLIPNDKEIQKYEIWYLKLFKNQRKMGPPGKSYSKKENQILSDKTLYEITQKFVADNYKLLPSAESSDLKLIYRFKKILESAGIKFDTCGNEDGLRKRLFRNKKRNRITKIKSVVIICSWLLGINEESFRNRLLKIKKNQNMGALSRLGI